MVQTISHPLPLPPSYPAPLARPCPSPMANMRSHTSRWEQDQGPQGMPLSWEIRCTGTAMERE